MIDRKQNYIVEKRNILAKTENYMAILDDGKVFLEYYDINGNKETWFCSKSKEMFCAVIDKIAKQLESIKEQICGRIE